MSLRKFNNFLSVLVIIVGLYIIISPLLPNIFFMFRDASPDHTAPYVGELAKGVGSDSESPPPEDNRIVIPGIGLNEPIIESNSISSIQDGGTWHRPQTVTPVEEGNSVIVGHRFFGSNVSTFYHLDKLIEDEIFAIYWEGEELLYKVYDKKIVDADAVEIEAPTADRRLTLYTCHPLWTSKQRLVIVAKPINVKLNVGALN